MMIIIYNFIALVIFLIYFPVYLLRRKFHSGLWQRLGVLPKRLNLGKPIWIHAVSVGEAAACRGLVDGLRKIYPEKKFVISTVTTTGNKIAHTIAQPGDFVCYLPLDFSFIVKKIITRVNPSLFIIAETEIWPNLITCLWKKGIPVVVVNARISDGSFRGYFMLRAFLKPILKKISLFCAQTQVDVDRLMTIGAEVDKIKVTGNMKFDLSRREYSEKDCNNFKEKLAITVKEKLLVAGSTHPGEEKIILEAYKSLLEDLPGLRLLIAPRHPERAQEVSVLIKDSGFEPLRTSLLNPSNPSNSRNPTTIFVLDTIGELLNYYAIADIVFVGGSLIKKGGHNILEPASLAKPIIFGQYMFNFRDTAKLFLKNSAAIQVNNAKPARAF
ncbi:MAG: 3-deoxy-D-manno-octulosonic acid transferase [Candidatus Omnitrophica bacterium]|nr:3-deoxy-D-manno-octulosonic acid transferase [Candidatus Omnitrophota bacterium]